MRKRLFDLNTVKPIVTRDALGAGMAQWLCNRLLCNYPGSILAGVREKNKFHVLCKGK